MIGVGVVLGLELAIGLNYLISDKTMNSFWHVVECIKTSFFSFILWKYSNCEFAHLGFCPAMTC